MADGILGTAFTQSFRTGFTGQTLTVDVATTTKPDGTAWTPTLTNVDPPSDLWTIAFTPDQAGVWVAEVTDADGRRYRGDYDILAAPSTTFSRASAGQRIRSAIVNELQQRLEELPF